MVLEQFLFIFIYYAMPFIAGTCLGSFYSVVIYRVPRGESIVAPGSYCPHCGAPVRPWNNIPLLSFIVQRGRCAACRNKISPVYPLTELLTGLAVIALFRWLPADLTGPHPAARILTVLTVSLLIPLTVIDARHGILPHLLTVPGMILAAGIAFFPGGITPLQMAAGGLVGGGTLWGIGMIARLFTPPERRVDGSTVGGGDVMLLILYGMLLGPVRMLLVLPIGSVTALAWLVFRSGKNRGAPFPFGPFLAAGIVISLFGALPLIDWYLSLL